MQPVARQHEPSLVIITVPIEVRQALVGDQNLKP